MATAVKALPTTTVISNAGLSTETKGFVSNPRAICIFIHRIYKLKMARSSKCSTESKQL